MNRFSLSLQLVGFPIRKARRMLADIQRIPSHSYPDILEARKQAIVEHHLNTNAFYKEFSGRSRFTTWSHLPIMTKTDLQRPMEERLSTTVSRKRIYIGKTSGSSGTPLVFAKDRFCHALSWAQFYHAYQQVGIDLDHSFQARFYGIPLDPFGNFKERLKDRVARRFRFPVFKLDEAVLWQYLQLFQKHKFQYLNGFTSVLVLFANFLKEQSLVLKNICPDLQLCIGTSEMLFPEDRELLQTQFGVPVINEYGASEFGLLALENLKQEWEITRGTCFVEIVNDQGEPVPNGEEGRIIVTSLFNKAHPFIRYDIGDRGSLIRDQASSRILLKKLSGRSNDLAVLPGRKTVPGLTFYYVANLIIKNNIDLREFVVQQQTETKFCLIYVAPKTLSTTQRNKIQVAISAYLDHALCIEFKRVDFLERSSRGKLKQFESLL